MSGCTDGHDWQPAVNWVGRYRCIRCFAIGYRHDVTVGDVKRGSGIQPYKCKTQGCGSLAHRWIKRKRAAMCSRCAKELEARRQRK